MFPGTADHVEVRMRVCYVGKVCVDDRGVAETEAVPMKKTFQICGVVSFSLPSFAVEAGLQHLPR